jgi:hypothetical protein
MKSILSHYEIDLDGLFHSHFDGNLWEEVAIIQSAHASGFNGMTMYFLNAVTEFWASADQ